MGNVPPEAEITSPDWYAQVDPGQAKLDVRRRGGLARGHLQLPALRGARARSRTTRATSSRSSGGWCDGSARNGAFDGVLGSVDMAALKALFPPSAGDFTGREPGTLGQSSNGRPNSEPYGFTVKVVGDLRHAPGRGPPQPLPAPRRRHARRASRAELDGDGESSPVLYDLDGDNRNELILATADGDVHAMRPDGSELSGWPVRGDALPLHTGGRGLLERGRVGGRQPRRDPRLGGRRRPRTATARRRWSWRTSRASSTPGTTRATRLWTRAHQSALLGSARSRRSRTCARASRNRTQHGLHRLAGAGGPRRQRGGKLEVIAAAMDRHVYAWHDDGSPVHGFPVLVVDRSKVASVDPNDARGRRSTPTWATALNQGAIVDTPAVGDITGDGRPEIVVGTNEEYLVDRARRGRAQRRRLRRLGAGAARSRRPGSTWPTAGCTRSGRSATRTAT